MRDCDGNPAHLKGRARGTTIEVIVDADATTLCFRVNGGPQLEGLTGFPVLLPSLRPCVLLWHPGDRVSFTSPFYRLLPPPSVDGPDGDIALSTAEDEGSFLAEWT